MCNIIHKVFGGGALLRIKEDFGQMEGRPDVHLPIKLLLPSPFFLIMQFLSTYRPNMAIVE